MKIKLAQIPNTDREFMIHSLSNMYPVMVGKKGVSFTSSLDYVMEIGMWNAEYCGIIEINVNDDSRNPGIMEHWLKCHVFTDEHGEKLEEYTTISIINHMTNLRYYVVVMKGGNYVIYDRYDRNTKPTKIMACGNVTLSSLLGIDPSLITNNVSSLYKLCRIFGIEFHDKRAQAIVSIDKPEQTMFTLLKALSVG